MEKHTLYKCSQCGFFCEVVKDCSCEECNMTCCGENMEKVSEKKEEEGNEKHLPVVEKTEKGYKVKVGEVAHPMEEAHHIEWIELITEKEVQRKYLEAGEAPETEFCTDATDITVRENCNVHGTWSTKA